MDKPLSRLKSIAVKKDLKTLNELYMYVHKYCGTTLMEAVEEYSTQMEEFFDAMEVAQMKARPYRRPHRHHQPRLKAKK